MHQLQVHTPGARRISCIPRAATKRGADWGEEEGRREGGGSGGHGDGVTLYCPVCDRSEYFECSTQASMKSIIVTLKFKCTILLMATIGAMCPSVPLLAWCCKDYVMPRRATTRKRHAKRLGMQRQVQAQARSP